MATGDFLGNLKHKVRSMYNNFFYDGEAPAPSAQEETYEPQEPRYTAAAAAQGNAWQQPQQPAYNAYAAYPQQPYQQPAAQPQAAPAYQSQQQSAYQQPAAPQQPRNRRMLQHAAQQENNVVDFGVYHQQLVPSQQPAAPVEAPAAPAQENGMANARIINARGMGDCRSAITLLRNGDTVLIVLENVTDPAEMRRLVDTLSGACYSLTATITKVSRYGVYLLAPQNIAVYADQATNQMNSAPGRMPMRGQQPQPGYAPQQRMAYPAAPQQVPQQMAYSAPQGAQGFTQRTAMPEEAAQPFYARTAPQAAPAPAFAHQQAGYGYAPDEGAAVDQ